MIAAQIDDLGVFFLHFFQHRADDTTVAILPTASSTQRPAIDDVTIEHELAALDVLEEKTAGGIILPESVKDAEKNKPLSAIALYEVDIAAAGSFFFGKRGCKVWVRSYVVDSYDQAGTFVACEDKDVWAIVE